MIARGSTYQRSLNGAKCHRCEIIYSDDFPRFGETNHCAECEYELEHGRMRNDWIDHIGEIQSAMYATWPLAY